MVFLFRSRADFYPGASVARLNAKVPVADAEVRRVFLDKLPPKLPYATPNQPVVLIMHREIWDDASPEVKTGLVREDPTRILLMTPATVVIDTGRVPIASGMSRILREP